MTIVAIGLRKPNAKSESVLYICKNLKFKWQGGREWSGEPDLQEPAVEERTPTHCLRHTHVFECRLFLSRSFSTALKNLIGPREKGNL